eukprot:13632758-Ditylum_brightwellii.AAC.1
MKKPGSAGGPSEKHTKRLEVWKESGYNCGDKPKGRQLHVMQRALCCGQQIENQYYEPILVTGKEVNGRSVFTEAIYCLCYDCEV